MEPINEQRTSAQDIQNSSGFAEDSFKDPRNTMQSKLQKFWAAIRYYGMQIWPYFRQLINFLIYQTIKVVKAIVRIGLSQTGLIRD